MALDKRGVDGDNEFESALTKAKRGDGDGFQWLYTHYNRRVGALVRSEACPDPDAVSYTHLTLPTTPHV